MKLIILAGGFARRLAPISDFIPKPLLPIAGKPLLDHILDKVKNVEFDEIIISTNSKFRDQFLNYIYLRENRLKSKLELVIEPTKEEKEKFGAIKGISYVIKKLDIHDDVAVIAGDNFFDFDLAPAFEEFNRNKRPLIGVYDVESLEEAKRFGVVLTDIDGKIVELSEKPHHPKSALISIGLYILPASTLRFIDQYISYGHNKDSPGHFIHWLAGKTEIYSVPFRGVWADIGTINSYSSLFNRYAEY